MTRYTFNRKGEVIPLNRPLSTEFLTSQAKAGNPWEHSWPIYAPRRSSPARQVWKAQRAMARAAARGNLVAA